MNNEFHYFITKGIALRAEFNKDQAEIIAHASQLTDDNVWQYRINRGKLDEFKNYISDFVSYKWTIWTGFLSVISTATSKHGYLLRRSFENASTYWQYAFSLFKPPILKSITCFAAS